MTDFPPWSDASLSKELPILRARGENQDLEFMESFPEQARDLAKEIAAFATSNTGMILLGVSDSGDISGLPETTTLEDRDNLLRRVEGIARSSVKPAVTPVAKWLVESGRVVLSIAVPRGTEPVYYASGKPYVRHITESRPAEPHEVVALIRQHLATQLDSSADANPEESTFYSALARILANTLIWAENESEERFLNPWLEEWRTDYASAATQLRAIASEDVATRLGLDASIRELADALDAVATLRLYLGNRDELIAAAETASKLFRLVKSSTVDTIPLGAKSIESIGRLLRSESRKLADLADRAKAMGNAGRLEDLQQATGDIGRTLIRVSAYRLEALGEGMTEALRALGRELHLLETIRLFVDGGVSMREIVRRVEEGSERLTKLIDRIGG